MRLVECVLIEDCLAPKRVGNMKTNKPFRRGQRVRGVVENIALTPDHQVLALKTESGHLIPEPFLNVLGEVPNQKAQASSKYGDIEDAEVIEDEDLSIENKGVKGIIDNYGKMKASSIVSKNALKSKHTINFALAGGAIGLVYAMLKGKNKMLLATIGAVGGGVLGNYYGNKIKDNETTNT
jgi:hypothetical protein